MVVKECIICGKTFDARGFAKCCSPECSERNRLEKKKTYYEDNKDEILEKQKTYRETHKDEILEKQKTYYEDNKDEILEKKKTYYEAHKDEILEKQMLRDKKEISKLCKQYNGDLEQILENIPTRWQIREAKMRVWFGESYADGMVAKIKSTPVCEVTGEKTNDLVIHHLYSFNTHPELGNDPANMVRITDEVHKAFHKEYGHGDNTPEQWAEFVKNL